MRDAYDEIENAFLNMSHNNFCPYGLEFLFTVVAIFKNSG